MNLEFLKTQNLGSLLMRSSQSNFNLRSPSSQLSNYYCNLKICPSISDPSRRKSVEPEKGSFRNQNQRTRSASRERNLVKIKFCWRCHQTGHESFDCTAELQPANWCPRCLESSHWEDSCWVNEQEVRKICVKKCQAKFLVGLV